MSKFVDLIYKIDSKPFGRVGLALATLGIVFAVVTSTHYALLLSVPRANLASALQRVGFRDVKNIQYSPDAATCKRLISDRGRGLNLINFTFGFTASATFHDQYYEKVIICSNDSATKTDIYGTYRSKSGEYVYGGR